MKTKFSVVVGGAIMLLAALALIAASGWRLRFTTEQAAFWDIAVKIIGGIVAGGGFLLAIFKYIHEKRNENKAAIIEAMKPFITKRQEIYYNLLSATATMGNSDPSSEEYKDAERQFWHIFWGLLPMVADDDVGAATNAFSVALDEPREPILIRNASMNIALACRRSLNFFDHS